MADGSAADQAGLRAGDQLLSVDGKATRTQVTSSTPCSAPAQATRSRWSPPVAGDRFTVTVARQERKAD
jgi:C-terminal processing protease CtpA/Prc